jgi:hypothetical protein
VSGPSDVDVCPRDIPLARACHMSRTPFSIALVLVPSGTAVKFDDISAIYLSQTYDSTSIEQLVAVEPNNSTHIFKVNKANPVAGPCTRWPVL